MAITLTEYLLNQIDEEVDRVMQDMADGGCKSHEDYKNKCGFISGLYFVRSQVKDIDRKYEEEHS